MSRSAKQAKQEAPRRTWPTWAKSIVSLLLLIHMTAIFATESAEMPSSEVEQITGHFFAPYCNFINQQNTHRYFSPQPGPTPTLLFRLRYKDGRPDELVRIPDPKVKPRIRFQRQLAIAFNFYFEHQQVSRQLFGANTPTEMQYPIFFARRLCKTHPGCESVEAILRIHNFPPPEIAYKAAATTGTLDLDQPEFYRSYLLGVYNCDELGTP